MKPLIKVGVFLLSFPMDLLEKARNKIPLRLQKGVKESFVLRWLQMVWLIAILVYCVLARSLGQLLASLITNELPFDIDNYFINVYVSVQEVGLMPSLFFYINFVDSSAGLGQAGPGQPRYNKI